MNGINDHKNQTQNYGHGIVSQDCNAELHLDATVSFKTVGIGTLVQVHSVRRNKVFFRIVHDGTMQVEVNQMVCKKADIINVPESLWRPLFAVKKEGRLSLVKDGKVAESIGNISVGDTVCVLGPNDSFICNGIVAFRNSIKKLGVGIYFGLQVKDSNESLETITKEVSVLRPGTKGFPRGCDIVVTVDKIRPSSCNFSKERTVCHFDREYKQQFVKSLSVGENVNNASFHLGNTYNPKDKHSFTHYKDQQTSNSDAEVCLSHSCVKKIIDLENSLNMGDEVIYPEDSDKGVLKWAGLIENSPRVGVGVGVGIGVELDRPIGNGTGTPDSLGESFGTKYQHSWFVPSMNVTKISDYLENTLKESIH